MRTTTVTKTCCKPGFSQVLCRRGHTNCGHLRDHSRYSKPKTGFTILLLTAIKMFRFTLSAIKYETKYEIRKSIPFGSIFDLFLLFGLKTRCVNFYSSPDEETFGTGACFYFLLAKVSLRPERTWKHSWERLINTDHELSHTQIISASMSVPLTVCVYLCDFNSLSLPSDLLKRTVHPKMKTLSSFTHPHVVPNPCDFLSFVKHKMIRLLWKRMLSLRVNSERIILLSRIFLVNQLKFKTKLTDSRVQLTDSVICSRLKQREGFQWMVA